MYHLAFNTDAPPSSLAGHVALARPASLNVVALHSEEPLEDLLILHVGFPNGVHSGEGQCGQSGVSTRKVFGCGDQKRSVTGALLTNAPNYGIAQLLDGSTKVLRQKRLTDIRTSEGSRSWSHRHSHAAHGRFGPGLDALLRRLAGYKSAITKAAGRDGGRSLQEWRKL